MLCHSKPVSPGYRRVMLYHTTKIRQVKTHPGQKDPVVLIGSHEMWRRLDKVEMGDTRIGVQIGAVLRLVGPTRENSFDCHPRFPLVRG